MRSYARTCLGLLGLTLIAPINARAQDFYGPASAGYKPAPTAAVAPTPAPAAVPVGPDGKPVPAAGPAEAPHKHRGRTICAKCAAKQGYEMPPGKIVGCEHSKNGVCTACAAALNMPGRFVTAGATAPEAPGRAVVSSARPSASAVAIDGAAGDPMPVGVIQAGFSQNASMGMQPQAAQAVSQPGHAVAESGLGHDPYQSKSSGFPHPHILGHLFGWSGIGAERAEEKARRKSEAHAMISYDSDPSKAGVNDLPASAVYGKSR